MEVNDEVSDEERVVVGWTLERSTAIARGRFLGVVCVAVIANAS